ncbi:hypothetical protein [Kribbella deserti]|uniref:Uncharacterized protein n=1 Tax=Kribbella deserti TaxID=1926257 RepID=A0ABV6QS96_9ACTN
MHTGDSAAAFSTAVAALNDVLRLEQVRVDGTVENWQQILDGLDLVITRAGRLTDCVADHLVTTSASQSVRRISVKLDEASVLIASARSDLDRLPRATHEDR